MRNEIDELRTFRADTPAPTLTAWTRADAAIAAARDQRGRQQFWGLPRWRVLTALVTVPALAAAVLVAITLQAPASNPGKAVGSKAGQGAALTWSLAGYLAPKGWRLNAHGPAPGAMTAVPSRSRQGRATSRHTTC